MKKIPSLALLAGGVVLIIYGLHCSDSVSSGFSRLFTGSPTEQSIWMLLVGIGAAAFGAVNLLRGSKAL